MTTLSLDQLRTIVPAAFATEPRSDVSDRYDFIPTLDAINYAMNRGWFPVRARQSVAAQDQIHAKHSIMFRAEASKLIVGDIFPELTLINSHDRTRSLVFRAGLFRLACSNGMSVAISGMSYSATRVHLRGGNPLPNLFNHALDQLEPVTEAARSWQTRILSAEETTTLAKKAVLIRCNGNKLSASYHNHNEYLIRRRGDDERSDLWTVYNVLQENSIRGGIQGPVRALRGINTVEEITRINQELWTAAEEIYGNN
jgi:hypothetical protein